MRKATAVSRGRVVKTSRDHGCTAFGRRRNARRCDSATRAAIPQIEKVGRYPRRFHFGPRSKRAAIFSADAVNTARAGRARQKRRSSRRATVPRCRPCCARPARSGRDGGQRQADRSAFRVDLARRYDIRRWSCAMRSPHARVHSHPYLRGTRYAGARASASSGATPRATSCRGQEASRVHARSNTAAAVLLGRPQHTAPTDDRRRRRNHAKRAQLLRADRLITWPYFPAADARSLPTRVARHVWTSGAAARRSPDQGTGIGNAAPRAPKRIRSHNGHSNAERRFAYLFATRTTGGGVGSAPLPLHRTARPVAAGAAEILRAAPLFETG